MCGLFGYRLRDDLVSAPPMFPVFASVVAVAMERRGTDGWGFAGLRPFAHDLEILKCEDKLTKSLDSHIFGAFHSMILHTRARTHGDHKIDNNHPFHISSLVGAHNGVVYNVDELDKKYAKRHHEVDSMHLFSHLATTPNDMKDIETYGALEWYDTTNPHRTFLCRMYHGQLTVAKLYFRGSFAGPPGGPHGSPDEPFAIVWSSTQSSIEEACSISGFDFQPFEPLKNCLVYRVTGEPNLWETGLTLDVRDKSATVVKSSPYYTSAGMTAEDWADYQHSRGGGRRGRHLHSVDSPATKSTTSSETTSPFRGRRNSRPVYSIFAEMKPLARQLKMSENIYAYEICSGCGVYYSLIEAPHCFICGLSTSLISETWASRRYHSAEPHITELLREGHYTPPLPKKVARKYARVLEDLMDLCAIEAQSSSVTTNTNTIRRAASNGSAGISDSTGQVTLPAVPEITRT